MEKGIGKIFSEVNRTYELVNHVLTFGFDILWRKKAAKIAAQADGERWLDVCSGTGEMAVYLRKLAKDKTKVIAADFCLPMIKRITGKPDAQKIILTLADAKSLPFADNTFDLITISFATRNINVTKESLTGCLREFRRVLRPGGRFVNLETSQPSSSLFRRLFHLYIRLIVKPVGYIISGSKEGYAYLSYTIPRFYDADEFAAIILQTGFAKVSLRRFMFGIAAVHCCIK